MTVDMQFATGREAMAAVTQSAGEAAQAQREAAQAQREAAQAQREAATEARQAAREAAQEAREATQESRSGGGIGTVTITQNGKTVTLDGASPEAVATALGIPLPDRQQESDGPYVVAGLAIVSTALVVLASVVMWYRTRMRGVTGGAAQMPAELTQRMARMENAIESVAVEVERISEGQRFTTRLLSDRAPQEVPRG